MLELIGIGIGVGIGIGRNYCLEMSYRYWKELV